MAPAGVQYLSIKSISSAQSRFSYDMKTEKVCVCVCVLTEVNVSFSGDHYPKW